MYRPIPGKKEIALPLRVASSGAFDIELPGELQGIRSIEELPIMVDGNSIIRFADIAEIRDTFKDASNFARVNGQPSVSISVSKRTGTNTLDVTARIKAVIEAATSDTEITAEPKNDGGAS